MPGQLVGTTQEEFRFHRRLKLATRPAHRRLEACLPLLDKVLTVREYRRLLRTFLGFYVPLEGAMEACHIPSLKVDLAGRRKSQWLQADLLSLGDTPEMIRSLPLCCDLAPLTCQAEVLGACYVVEGATLGGQIIVHHLRRTLGLHADRSVRFFTSYGSRVPRKWAAFVSMLETAAYDATQEQMIINSASRTFGAFEQWLLLNHSHERCSIGYRPSHKDTRLCSEQPRPRYRGSMV